MRPGRQAFGYPRVWASRFRAPGVTRQVLSHFLNEKTALAAELALRIGMAFGCSMETLMALRPRFAIANAREHQAGIPSERAAALRVQEPGDRPEPIVKRTYGIG